MHASYSGAEKRTIQIVGVVIKLAPPSGEGRLEYPVYYFHKLIDSRERHSVGCSIGQPANDWKMPLAPPVKHPRACITHGTAVAARRTPRGLRSDARPPAGNLSGHRNSASAVFTRVQEYDHSLRVHLCRPLETQRQAELRCDPGDSNRRVPEPAFA